MSLKRSGLWERRDQVFHGLYACGLRAVLAEEDCDVHAPHGHIVVEALRDEGPLLVVEVVEGHVLAEVLRPLAPLELQGGQTRRVDVGVYQGDAVLARPLSTPA